MAGDLPPLEPAVIITPAHARPAFLAAQGRTRRFAVPSTPANPPRRGSTRNSIHCRRSARFATFITSQRPSLCGALAVTNGIVRVPLEPNVRIVSRHPRVERIVQEQVCKERADDPTLRRSRCARPDAAVLHLHRRLQPALDVEQHPRAVRMITHAAPA